MVLQEAMAAGVPVIARRGNGRDVLTASDEIIQTPRRASYATDGSLARL